MADPRRAEIGQRILNLLAGLPHDLALDIQTDVLATCIGGVTYLSGGSLPEASAQLQIVTEHAAQHILTNWGQIESTPTA